MASGKRVSQIPFEQGPRDWLRQTAGAAAPSGGSWLLGSDANFAAMRSIAPFGQAEGLANLDSDPKNQRGGYWGDSRYSTYARPRTSCTQVR